jgi:hypothetical protein
LAWTNALAAAILSSTLWVAITLFVAQNIFRESYNDRYKHIIKGWRPPGYF